MGTKPKILASNPRAIIMLSIGLSQDGKSKLNCENEAKMCIFLAFRHLRRICLASFFGPFGAQRVGWDDWRNLKTLSKPQGFRLCG
jgi:hypothetical protein